MCVHMCKCVCMCIVCILVGHRTHMAERGLQESILFSWILGFNSGCWVQQQVPLFTESLSHFTCQLLPSAINVSHLRAGYYVTY